MNFYELMPKIELHLHLEGAIPLEYLWELVKKYDKAKEVTSLEQLKSKFEYKDFANFIDVWVWKNQFLREYDDFEFISEGFAKDLKNQNIKYSEVFISPSSFRNILSTLKIIEVIRKGINKVNGIKISLIVDFVRNSGQENELITLHEINEAKEYGIVGIGLGGSEHAFPAKDFPKLFEKAREFGFRTTAHAGEADGPKSIWDAINILKVERIGHGLRAIEDELLIEYLANNKIPIELCPISNVKTKSIDHIKNHPIKKYIEKGIPISINTDDPKMFGNTLAEEYNVIASNFNFSKAGISEIILKSIDTTWLEKEEKDLLKQVFIKEIKSLESGS